jgi:hypothetical protein
MITIIIDHSMMIGIIIGGTIRPRDPPQIPCSAACLGCGLERIGAARESAQLENRHQ